MENEKRHAIIIIKKDNEYLQYYDERWNGHLFLNCKLKDENDISKIKEEARKVLGPNKKIKVNYLWDIVHTKFSESAKIYKLYRHYFFDVNTKYLPEYMLEKEFTLNQIKYRWFSMEELESDPRIQEINSDIVGWIKENGF